MNNFFRKIGCHYFCNTSIRRTEAVDPIQALFVKYVKEYYRKLKENKGVLFDVPPELENDRLEKEKTLAMRYFGDVDPSSYDKFPEIKYEEPQLDGIDLPESHPLMGKR